jgi:phosphatidate cytidylyltransferase
MLIKRAATALILALVGIPAIIFGGVYYFGLILLFLGVAAWEMGLIFRKIGCRIPDPLLIGSVVLIAVTRTYFPNLADATLTLAIFAAMTWHLLDYEKGRAQAATDFAATLAGIVYIGWIGTYLIDLRFMPNGLWWLLIVLPTIWMADMGAFFIGSRFGKHKLSPRLSPKKSWEGYWAGVILGTLSSIGLALLWHTIGGPVFIWWKAAALGGILSLLTTLGDLGESMFKRQAGLKDSSNIFPGHGGVLDRIDSWLWGAALGFFIIGLFMV